MKSTIYLAILALSFTACKKNSFSVPETNMQPSLQASIYHSITEPREMNLGNSNAIFYAGERITIYVPYQCNYDKVTTATLTVVDEAGEQVASIDMSHHTDIEAGSLNVPILLQGTTFAFAVINLDEQYAGKTFSIKTQVSGDKTLADDFMQNAFSVQ